VHFLQALDRVHHLVSGLVLLDDPVDQVVHLSPVLGTNVGGVLVKVLEVIVLFKPRDGGHLTSSEKMSRVGINVQCC
jgi:hypothetical protein